MGTKTTFATCSSTQRSGAELDLPTWAKATFLKLSSFSAMLLRDNWTYWTKYSWGRTQSNWDCRTVSHLWRNVNRNHIEIESEIEIWILKLNWSWKKISFSTEITEGEKNDIVLIHLGSGNGQILATQLRKKLRKLGPEQQQQEELVVGAGAWKGVTWSTEQIE